MENTVAVSAGWNHSLAVKIDGTLWAWGQNGYGQLGDGTISDQLLPVKIMSDVIQVSAGDGYTMILKTDGTLWACGNNYYGQLGDGSKTNRNKPIQIMNEVAAVSAGGNHTLAIKTDSTLWSWGRNDIGELGDGTTIGTSTPKRILSGITGASAGGMHSLAIKSDGTLLSWGYNYFGQLGDGANINRFAGDPEIDRHTPVTVMTGVATITAGDTHTMILKTDGTLLTCGWNNSGELGDGTSISRSLPVQIMYGVAAISAGGMHSLALKTDGTLYTWGNNDFGQLGDKTNTQRTSPLQVMNSVATTTPPANPSANPSHGNPGFSNFVNINTYTVGKFTDVPENSWFTRNVATAYELGLMSGTSNTYFNATGNISIAETIALACRLHSKYYADGEEFTLGDPWYQVYIDYAIDKGILSITYSNYNKAATRAEFASILSKAFPNEALSVLNVIPDDSIPDVPISASYAPSVYILYRAGVITGSDSFGTFNPNATIGRNEAAAIITRMAILSLRKSVVFSPITATSIMLSTTALSIEEGQTATISATITPSNAADKSVIWSSSDYGVVTVSNGVIKGLRVGTATIIATASNGITAISLITVTSSSVCYSGYYPAPDFGAYLNVTVFKTASNDASAMFAYKAQDISVSSNVALTGYVELLEKNNFYYLGSGKTSDNTTVLIYKNDSYGVSVSVGTGMISGYACVQIMVSRSQGPSSEYYSGHYPAPDFGAYLNVTVFKTASNDTSAMFAYKAQDISVSSNVALTGYVELLEKNNFYYLGSGKTSDNTTVLIYKNDSYGVSVSIGTGMISGYACVQIMVSRG